MLRVLGSVTCEDRLRELGWFSLVKGSQKALVMAVNIPRGYSQHELHFRNLMMDVRRIFFTQRVIQHRNKPSEWCLNSFPGKLSRLH